ncbi:MAG: WYL domain-containing transcriptional regulator [Eubacteriales bacterium]|nr:WYL domain-containing transcriptional regulator [Eubacteriales bacterium]
MARSSQQKLKILYMLRLFMEKTDEQHPITVAEIMEYLSGYGIMVERKTVYDDIETLRLFGLDIINRRAKPSGFYLGSREFELAELKLLVDAVQSSKFITGKKSTQLIHKIESLTSKYEARQLHRQVFVEHRVKSMNESVYYNIDEIHQAIDGNTQISFQYYEWTILKEMRLRKNGERYRISPWGLIWKDENYYLVGLDEKSKIVKHYRVDKMLKIRQEPEKRNGQEIFEGYDAALFATRTFGMFGGKEEVVTLSFKNHLVGVVIDRFGQEVMIRRQDPEHFCVSVKVNISTQFFAWLCGLGDEVTIEKPMSIRNEYQEYLTKILSNYTKE